MLYSGWMKRSSVTAGIVMLLAFAAGIISGCQMAGQVNDPQDLFKQTVSGLSGTDDFKFKGTASLSVANLPMQESAAFEGEVKAHNRLAMMFSTHPQDSRIGGSMQQAVQNQPIIFSRENNKWVVSELSTDSDASILLKWSPLYKLEKLNTMSKQIEGMRDESNRRITVLTIKPEKSEVTAQMKEEVERQFRELDTDRKLADLKQRLGLSDNEARRMRGEVERTVQNAKRKLEEVSRTLQADSTYRIDVDRINRLPRSMEVATRMTYILDGEEKQEITHVRYEFSEYGGRSS